MALFPLLSLSPLSFSALMSPSAPFMHAITAKVNRMRAPVAALHPLAQFTSARSCYHLRSLHGRSEDRGCDVGVWPDTVAVSKYMWFAWVSPLLRALLPRATWMLSYNRCRVFVCWQPALSHFGKFFCGCQLLMPFGSAPQSVGAWRAFRCDL